MDREQLEPLLAAGDGEAPSTALDALRDGASHVVWEGTTSAESLAHIYGRRLRHTLRKGIETTGLERAVELLSRHGQPVRLGQINSSDGAWVFMLFITEDGRGLVACTGVRQSAQSGPGS
ncbi:hypothetical protein OG453_05535 [Streptomyces sp. NBC_01381]|uniref:hypothetical protein n=1 Tax=Streptomyces sp. NBC_01381 TaxID=2903845 RepID=UPI0022543074|nr:hypothetical protein [Streptomyces sp. NBC_01381]MCX4666128.1 hypothetical protein [Streptomyces sp. NBC_01381]